MTLKHFENKGRVNPGGRFTSKPGVTAGCRGEVLPSAWSDDDDVRSLAEGYLAGKKRPASRRNIRRNCVVSSEAQEKRREKARSLSFRREHAVRNRAVQAYWAMHVEAMNWSGMSAREYAAALHLSPTSLRKWRDRLDDGEVDIDWRAHLHPSARPVAGTSANRTPPETGLTAPPSDDPAPPRQPLRRFFSDEQKRAIALESDQPGVSVSQVARKHGIVTGHAVPLARAVRRGAEEAREACARRAH